MTAPTPLAATYVSVIQGMKYIRTSECACVSANETLCRALWVHTEHLYASFVV